MAINDRILWWIQYERKCMDTYENFKRTWDKNYLRRDNQKIVSIYSIIKWLLVLGGVGLGGAAGGLYYKNRGTGKLDITKVTPKTANADIKASDKAWPPDVNVQTASVPSNLDRYWTLISPSLISVLTSRKSMREDFIQSRTFQTEIACSIK